MNMLYRPITKEELRRGWIPMGCHENHIWVFRQSVLERIMDGGEGVLLCNDVLVVDRSRLPDEAPYSLW
jgi:hypothetical protein